MDKESLSQYGWVIIIIVVLAILIGIAPNFAELISENVEEAVTDFAGKADAALEGAGAEG